MDYSEQMQQLNTAKTTAEVSKLVEETINYRKRNKWFEVTMAIAIFAAGIAFAKLFI